MKRLVQLAALLTLISAAATLGGTADAQAQVITRNPQETAFVLTGVEIDRRLPLFAYCFAPDGAQPVVTLHRPGRPKLGEQLKAEPSRSTSGLWSVWEFGTPSAGWPDRMDVACRVQTRSIADENRGRVILFTLNDERPVPNEELNRNTNIRFDPRPVKDRETPSGRFTYDVPWAADVSIYISRRTDSGLEDTKIVIEDQKSGAGVHSTDWGTRHQFDAMDDGDYEGKIVAKKTGSGQSSRATKTMLATALFRRKK